MYSSPKKLSTVDRFLTLWIALAMLLGVGLGFAFPGYARIVSGMNIGSTSVPLAIGLILMMYPPLAKVRYESIGTRFRRGKLLTLSLVMNWVVGPVVMTALAVIFLSNHPEYMIGVVLVGLARCIAMVIVWNDLAGGQRELGVGLVALNALFQVLFYAAYIYLFINVFLNATGLMRGAHIDVSFWESALTVLIYLGTPFAAGLLSRLILVRLKGKEWYEKKFLPKISPLTLIFLLLTIVIMFSLKGDFILKNPVDVLLVAIPFAIYFLLVWFVTFFAARWLGGDYAESTAVAFSAASNDFELAIAVAIALWGVASAQAFAAVIGPLIEVPVMVILVRIAKYFQPRLWKQDAQKEAA